MKLQGMIYSSEGMKPDPVMIDLLNTFNTIHNTIHYPSGG